MSSLNKKVASPVVLSEVNHAGLAVKKQTAEDTLTRVTLANMLFEDQFYIDGKSSADVLKTAISAANPLFAMDLAKKARKQFKLRHVPLMIVRELVRNGYAKAQDIADVIQRPDEMGELLAMYNADGKKPLSHQLKKGLALAFGKFNEYQLAKNDKNSAAYSVRDVMFLTRPKPVDEERESLYKRIANKEMVTPDTWETQLSAGANKKETFERLMAEKKLGALAFLRNLRNMTDAGISSTVIREYSKEVNVANVLPFRYIAAARIVPQYEDMLEAMMFRSLEGVEKLPGKTVLMIDVSGSMFGSRISGKSDLERFDAAAALAILCREVCEEVEIYSFSYNAKLVAPRRGFALREAIHNSQPHGGTTMGASFNQINSKTTYDRVICFTDDESSDRPAAPKGKGYIVNVAAYKNGVDHQKWTTITGFSEAVIDYIKEVEKFA